MDVKTLCLGVLSEGDATGYDIKKHFECSFSHFFVAGFGSIYPSLAELARDGLVTCREEAQDNRPDRKVYSITPKGRDSFLEALANTPPRHKIRSEFFVLLHFGHLLSTAKLKAVLDQRLADVERDVTMLETYFESAEPGECCLHPMQAFSVELAYETLKAHRDVILRKRDALQAELSTNETSRARRA